MAKRLSSGDVCEIAGLPMNTLDRWVAAGFVGPANAFEGHGRHRTYTLGQCLAVAAGALYRAEGANRDRVAGVIHFLAGRPIEQLEADLQAGKTFPVPGTMLGVTRLPGLMIEPPASDPSLTPGAVALMKRLDLAALYQQVQAKVAKLSKRPANKLGRSRGSARASKTLLA